MLSRLHGKIVSLTKVVRRSQTLAATSAALTLGSMTTLAFLPLSWQARWIMVVTSVLFFARKIYMYVYARHSTERLQFEERYISFCSDAKQIKDSLSPKSQMWNGSAIVRSVRSADYRPEVDASPASMLQNKLEKHLRSAFAAIMLPRTWPDSALLSSWIISWIYFAIVNPNPNVLAATVLFVTGLALFLALTWLELSLNLSVRDSRARFHRLYWDLAAWLIDQLAPGNEKISESTGYTRKEHFRDNPWFVSHEETVEP